ncbi:23S rRNA (guanosine(2251)-2'-O)-methyltransferase RlmB [Teichococcus wenyumeiae]|nr:23S rRNA (guanosine(2251)-2'-O)-methyltransferase RlmB [Pseudoroseomonas wenyumeiae]
MSRPPRRPGSSFPSSPGSSSPGRPPRERDERPGSRPADRRPPREIDTRPQAEHSGAPERRGRDHRGERPYAESPRAQARRASNAAAGEAEAARLGRDASMAAPSGSLWLYGMHAVAAALANPKRRVRRLLATTDAEETLAERLPRPWRVQAERVEKNRFQTFLTEDAVHQGVALLADPLPSADLEDAIAASAGPVLLLDQVTDPRNVGAILRSAAAFGVAAVVMQDRNAPPETAALARTASGALETVPVVREVNLSRTIQTLQKHGYWVMGLAGEAKRTLAQACPRDRRVALVLGAEDTGLRRLQRETCDELVRLPILPAMESLNVSAAATAALYELAREGQADES